MATNDILPFCPTDTGSNLISQGNYQNSADRTSGNKPGVASSALNNKAIRQASAVASQVAQFVSDKTGADVLDDGISAKLLAQINAAIQSYPPNITRLLSGSGTFNVSFIFHIVAGSATAGATYTNNGTTFTVLSTVASALTVAMTGSGSPAVSGTLTKASGTGDATLTFYAFRKPTYLRVCAAGGGGGGGGSGANGTGAGTGATGGNTTFGSSLIIASGASGGTGSVSGAGGGGSTGSTTVNAPAVAVFSQIGGYGQAGGTSTGTSTPIGMPGGAGAASFLGGNGGGGNTLGYSGSANTGGGGGGGGGGNQSTAGSSGGGGGGASYVEAIIPVTTTFSYPWAVGAGGNGGGSGSSGYAGGQGGSGILIVQEHYQ